MTGTYLLLCAISALCGLLYYAGNDELAVVGIVVTLALCILLLIGVCAAALLCGWVLVRLRPPVRAVEITEETVTLAGVAPAFARALEPKIGIERG